MNKSQDEFPDFSLNEEYSITPAKRREMHLRLGNVIPDRISEFSSWLSGIIFPEVYGHLLKKGHKFGLISSWNSFPKLFQYFPWKP